MVRQLTRQISFQFFISSFFLLFLEVTCRIVLTRKILFIFLGFFFHSNEPPTSARMRAARDSFNNSASANLMVKVSVNRSFPEVVFCI